MSRANGRLATIWLTKTGSSCWLLYTYAAQIRFLSFVQHKHRMEMKSDCRNRCHSFNWTPLLMLIAIISFVTRDNANGKRYRRYARPMNIKMKSIDRICTSQMQLLNTSNAIAGPEPSWPVEQFDAFLPSAFDSFPQSPRLWFDLHGFGFVCDTRLCHRWQSTKSFTPKRRKKIKIRMKIHAKCEAEWRTFANT